MRGVVNGHRFGGAFHPLTEFTTDELRIWCDAHETDYFTGEPQDYITLNVQGKVHQWLDRSGNELHVEKSGTFHSPPISYLTSFAPNRAIDFSASQKYLDIPYTGISGDDDRTFILVGESSGWDGVGRIGANSNSTRWGFRTNNAGLEVQVNNVNLKTDSFGYSALQNPCIMSWTLNGTQRGDHFGRVNGVQKAVSANTSSVSTGTEVGFLGQAATLDVVEFMVIKATLTPEQHAKIETYLSDKWGITLE